MSGRSLLPKARDRTSVRSVAFATCTFSERSQRPLATIASRIRQVAVTHLQPVQVESGRSQWPLAKMVQKMAAPGGPSANALAQEVGIHQSTLSRWLPAGVRRPGRCRPFPLPSSHSSSSFVLAGLGVLHPVLATLPRRSGCRHQAKQPSGEAWFVRAASLIPDVYRVYDLTREQPRSHPPAQS